MHTKKFFYAGVCALLALIGTTAAHAGHVALDRLDEVREGEGHNDVADPVAEHGDAVGQAAHPHGEDLGEHEPEGHADEALHEVEEGEHEQQHQAAAQPGLGQQEDQAQGDEIVVQ